MDHRPLTNLHKAARKMYNTPNFDHKRFPRGKVFNQNETNN